MSMCVCVCVCFRAVLRMLEGLQSSDSAIRSLTQSWVRAAVAAGGGGEGPHRLLQPLVRILLEADTKRKHRTDALLFKKITLSRHDAEKDMKYAAYYFRSLGMENPYLPSSKNQYLELVKHYTQTFDASQSLYALSLLQLVLGVDPSSFVCTVGNAVVDVSAYTTCGTSTSHCYTSGRARSPTDTPSSSSSLSIPSSLPPPPPLPPASPALGSQKSLLEVLLSACLDLLCSEYHPSLKPSPEEQLENLRVKISCASLLSSLLEELLKILARQGTSASPSSPTSPAPDEASFSSEFKVCSPNFVSALLTLCDIQKVALLLMGKAVEWWSDLTCRGEGVWSDVARRLAGTEGGGIAGTPGTVLRSFFVHLLRVVQCLVVLDTQFSQSLPIRTQPLPPPPPPTATTPPSSPSPSTSDLVTLVSGVEVSGGLLHAVAPPSCATASQYFFREFLLRVLSDSTLVCFHDNLLCMLTVTAPNLLSQQLTELAPQVVKQLCGNIEGAVAATRGVKRGRRGRSEEEDQKEHLKQSDIHLCILYFDTISAITAWCLFGDAAHRGVGVAGAGPERSQLPHPHSQPRCHRLHHRCPNPFFQVTRVTPQEHVRESFSPTSKPPSTMAWLLGVLTAQRMPSSSAGGAGGGVDSDPTSSEGGCSRVGVGSQAGQQLVMLLPAVYNSMTDMWAEFHCGGSGFGGVASGSVDSGVESDLFRKQSMVFEVRSFSVGYS